MGVVDYQQLVPAYVVHRDQVADGFLERLEGLVVIEIANVLADESLSVDDQGNGVLQVRTNREQRQVDRQFRNGSRGIAARAPQDDGPESADAGDGIVDAARDG